MLSVRRMPVIPRFKKRSGFTLIIVLIISLIGLAIVGVTLQMTVLSTGGGRIESAGNAVYNILQSAVQEGMAVLKKATDNTLPIPRYTDSSKTPVISEDDKITEADMLLLSDTDSTRDFPLGNAVTRELRRSDLGRLGIFGNSGTLSVKIYDMQYKPENIPGIGVNPGQITPEEYNMLPPSVIISSERRVDFVGGETQPTFRRSDGRTGTADNAGIYLVRATLTAGEGEAERKWVLDSVIIQANNEPPEGSGGGPVDPSVVAM